MAETGDPHGGARRRTASTVSLSVLIIVLLVVGFAGIAVLLRRGQDRPAVPDPATGVRDRAAAWVAHEVDRTARIACEPMMCDALLVRGAPSDRLRATAPDDDLPDADIMVVTPGLRGYRPRLDPRRLAAFGSGRTEVDVYALARRLAPEIDPAVTKERADRLLLSARTRIAPAARTPLSTGRVDGRLLSALNHATSTYVLGVGAFGPAAPGADAKSPVRAADVTSIDGARVAADAPATRTLLGVLRRGPNAGLLDLTFRTDREGSTVLHVTARVAVAATPSGRS